MDKTFFYNKTSKNLGLDMRKNLGMHLFKMRQGRNLTSEKVCQATEITQKQLDNIEIGREMIEWPLINKLLQYYRVKIKIELVSAESSEDKAQREKIAAEQEKINLATKLLDDYKLKLEG